MIYNKILRIYYTILANKILRNIEIISIFTIKKYDDCCIITHNITDSKYRINKDNPDFIQMLAFKNNNNIKFDLIEEIDKEYIRIKREDNINRLKLT